MRGTTWPYVALRGTLGQKDQVMPRVQETSLWRSDVRIVFNVLNNIKTEFLTCTEATQPEILALSS